MITEQQCIQELQKLNNYDYDLASSGIEPLELLARMRQCDGNSAEKFEISEKIKKIASEIPSDDLQSTAMCAYALSEAASLIANGYALNEISQLMADRILRSDKSLSPDCCACSSAMLMALQNSHLPPYMRPAYIGHARIYAKRAVESGGLSSLATEMLKISIKKLIDARRKYQW
ncbi:MAG: hypothetical protein E7395_03755 [Ruminococcaceae bacterium]|nr:hypothetical protein [Oscillospiraceae bacterium]